MIREIRDMRARLARLEAQLQHPTREHRDDGDLRLRVGRQPDGEWTARAFDAGGSQIADLVDDAERIALLEAGPTWTNATLLNSWTNAGGFAPASYANVGGRVYLRGLITGGTTTAGTALFTLPVGYRPPYRAIFYPWVGGHRLDVLTDGTVELTTYSGAAAFISLDQIAFWTS